jgi:hypothetical protein
MKELGPFPKKEGASMNSEAHQYGLSDIPDVVIKLGVTKGPNGKRDHATMMHDLSCQRNAPQRNIVALCTSH